ncbi:replication initiator protein [Dipodfec virus UOA04_Rod_575]|nr:replication initiator protein [Dipodfec virus UOA04_Rod_575]
MLTQFRFPNNSHYRVQGDKSHFDLPNPKNFDLRKQRQSAYYIRNYYEFQSTVDAGGFVTFYTFTFNDKALKRINGRNVLDNAAISWLLRDSGLRKSIQRLGFKFKYFIAPEYGEGKGLRGYGNNPHYHGIFYFLPIDPIEFKVTSAARLVTREFRQFWQGNSHHASCKNDARNFRFGKLDVSKKGALVQDFKAIRYASKYVVKDATCFKNINHIKSYYLKVAIPRYLIWYDFHHDHVIFRWICKKSGYDANSILNAPRHQLRNFLMSDLTFLTYFDDLIEKVWKHNTRFSKTISKRHYPKVYISKGFGAAALDHLTNDYKIKVPDVKKGWTYLELPLYLKRKLFYDVVKSPDGVPSYVLNSRGIFFMSSRIDSKVEKSRLNTHNCLSRVLSFHDSDMSDFEVCFCELYKFPLSKLRSLLPRFTNDSFYPELLNSANFFHPDFDFRSDVLYLHSIYNCIYKYRRYVDNPPILYPWRNFFVYPHSSAPSLIPTDYACFISLHNADYRSYYDIRLDKSLTDGYLYSCHPAFIEFRDVFYLLDCICDYFKYNDLQLLEKKFIENKRLNNFHRCPYEN